MKRRILIALLSAGTLLGFASGFASLRQCSKHRRDAFERHVASLCAEAAQRSTSKARAVGDSPPED